MGVTVNVFAQEHPTGTSGIEARPKATLKFLDPSQVDPTKLLPAPEKDGSEFQQRELSEVKRLIRTRSKARYEQAVWDARHEDASPFLAVIAADFDLKKFPATSKLLGDVLSEQAVVADKAKTSFKRKFPLAADAPAESYSDWTCDVKARQPSALPLRSYPSGHATMAYSVGVILAALVPEKSQELLARSACYAYSREICGDHYHSDVEAGHVLGTTIGVLLLSNTALKPEIEASRVELRAAHLTESSE
jgi:acid phosphatase (class A)